MTRRDHSPTPRQVLDQALRHDLTAFTHRVFQTIEPGQSLVPNWHHEVLADHLERCLSGEIRFLLISVPPRSLKSIMTSVALPALVLGRHPSERIICASYDQELADKHARDCKAIMGSDWYQRLFRGTILSRNRNAVGEFTTTMKGSRLATSIGGSLTGRGANLIIVDDPLKAEDAMSEARREAVKHWFSNTLYSRLDDKNRGRIIVVMQRLHPDDLIGHLLDSGQDWHHLRLPAIADQDEAFMLRDGRTLGRSEGEALDTLREPLSSLERTRASIGDMAFSAQYLQEPLPLEGGLINWSWFRFYDGPPERKVGDIIVQSWDTASKADELSDYSVCTTWLRRDNQHYLLDVDRARRDYPALKQRVLELHKRHEADAVLIEDRSSGIQLIQDLRDTGQLYPIAINPEGDKVTRMYGQSARIEAGQVLLPRTASWLDAFQREVVQFPHARHDDQIDSLSQYLVWATPISKAFSEFRPTINMLESASAPWDITPFHYGSAADQDPFF